MTADELAALPDDGYEYELVRGMPLPKAEHGEVTGNAALPLLLYARETDLATVFLSDTGVWLERDPDTVRGADIAVALNRLLPPKPRTRYLTIPPALIVEVALRFDCRPEIEEKIADYRRAGVSLIWYGFPQRRRVSVDGVGRERVVPGVADVLDGSEVLPGLPPIPVADLLR